MPKTATFGMPCINTFTFQPITHIWVSVYLGQPIQEASNAIERPIWLEILPHITPARSRQDIAEPTSQESTTVQGSRHWWQPRTLNSGKIFRDSKFDVGGDELYMWPKSFSN